MRGEDACEGARGARLRRRMSACRRATPARLQCARSAPYPSPLPPYSFPASRMMSVKISATIGAALFATFALAAHPARADAQDRSQDAAPARARGVLDAASHDPPHALPAHGRFARLGRSDHGSDCISSSLDDEMAFAFSDRGVKKVWVFPAAIDAIAKRNEPYAPDPHAHGCAVASLSRPEAAAHAAARSPGLAAPHTGRDAGRRTARAAAGRATLRAGTGREECAVLRFAIFDAVRAKII